MTTATARWLAGGLLLLAIAALVVSAWFGVASGDLMNAFAFTPLLLAFAAVGAIVASHRPANPIGWLFLAEALGFAGRLRQPAHRRGAADHRAGVRQPDRRPARGGPAHPGRGRIAIFKYRLYDIDVVISKTRPVRRPGRSRSEPTASAGTGQRSRPPSTSAAWRRSERRQACARVGGPGQPGRGRGTGSVQRHRRRPRLRPGRCGGDRAAQHERPAGRARRFLSGRLLTRPGDHRGRADRAWCVSVPGRRRRAVGRERRYGAARRPHGVEIWS
jgi:hypothetical protein